jgi:hypothetical protein
MAKVDTCKQRAAFSSSLLAFAIAILLYNSSSAIAQTPSQAGREQLSPASEKKINNVFGIRIGTGVRDGSATVLPCLNPYFEIPIGRIFFSAELQFAFINFSTINIFQTDNLHVDSYGWAGKCRWYYANTSSDDFFSSVGLGMTVHPNTVSVEIPISTGYLWTLSKSMELEGLVNFTPLDYLGQRLGWFVSATIGLRFLNF